MTRTQFYNYILLTDNHPTNYQLCPAAAAAADHVRPPMCVVLCRALLWVCAPVLVIRSKFIN